MEEDKNNFSYKLLMLTTLIISGCSICYELIISSVSSYLIGDSILQFSVTIGLYMCAMGFGSYISKFIVKDLFDKFVCVEIGVGILGGLSSIILFMSNLYLTSYQLVMYTEIILIGTLVGIEIPILTRIIEENANNLRVTLSSIFSFDYIGGLIGSIAFPLLLLPELGYFSTAFLVGACNIVVAMIIVFKYASYIKRKYEFKIICVLMLVLMLLGAFFSENISKHIENGLYRDKVIVSEHTQYQHIVLTRHKDDLRMYINGNIQFCSLDEYRYHEALVHIPMSLLTQRKNILILGGGDGLATREILKYEDVEHITMVDLDPGVIELCKRNPQILNLNQNSLNSEKLTIINTDAYKYLESTKDKYDLIIVDLPDPNNESLNKLYTNLFYRLCKNALTAEGIFVVQSTSPYYATDAFWCINKTIKSEKLNVIPYHVQVPSFGDWGFQMASKRQLNINDIKLTKETKFLNKENLKGIFAFGDDEKTDLDKIMPNTLSNPQLIQYYMKAEKEWY